MRFLRCQHTSVFSTFCCFLIQFSVYKHQYFPAWMQSVHPLFTKTQLRNAEYLLACDTGRLQRWRGMKSADRRFLLCCTV